MTLPQYAASRLPEVDRAADCPSGYTNNGLTCGRAPEDLFAPSRVADCPSGYTNTGLTCYRGPASYTKGCTTIFKKYSCKSGYTDTGCICQRWADTKSTSSMSCPAGYSLNTELGRCYKQCDAGYTNTGEFCHRDASTLGSDQFTCKADELLRGVRCYRCGPGTEYFAGLCYNQCPEGSKRTAVSTCEMTFPWRGNTHLRVVERAIELLARSAYPAAARAVAYMRAPSCRTQWETGLWDADSESLRDDPVNNKAHAGSHFFNAAHLDAWGKPSDIVTYQLGSADVTEFGGGLNAEESARDRITQVMPYFDDPSCYALGVALHYLTDVTQPMHATGYSALNTPITLHAVWEEYVPHIQERVVMTSWDERWLGKLPEEVFTETAIRSASYAPALMAALVKPNAGICTITPETGVTYTGYCFPVDTQVDAQTLVILQDAFQSTASYLFAVFSLKN